MCKLLNREKTLKKRGFTLIELVIVIVILGVLAGVAALSFTDVTKSTKEAVAKANLRVVKSAVQSYQVDHKGNLPKKITDLNKYLEGTVSEDNQHIGIWDIDEDNHYRLSPNLPDGKTGIRISVKSKTANNSAPVLAEYVIEGVVDN